jgi:PncC family amidohydrolase
VLGVPMEVLKKKGAVCAEVAEAMARGAIARSGASAAVAVTGVAGPEPDEDGNPVGLIYCAVMRRGQAPKSVRLQSNATQRRAILEDAATEALTLLRSVFVPE